MSSHPVLLHIASGTFYESKRDEPLPGYHVGHTMEGSSKRFGEEMKVARIVRCFTIFVACDGGLALTACRQSADPSLPHDDLSEASDSRGHQIGQIVADLAPEELILTNDLSVPHLDADVRSEDEVVETALCGNGLLPTGAAIKSGLTSVSSVGATSPPHGGPGIPIQMRPPRQPRAGSASLRRSWSRRCMTSSTIR